MHTWYASGGTKAMKQYTPIRRFYAWVGFAVTWTLAILFIGWATGVLYRAAKEAITSPAVIEYQAPDYHPAGPVAMARKTVRAVVTAYTSSIDETDEDPFITASGQMTREGIVANNCLPFGTFVWIGNKLYEVADRMNARYGCEHFDVWLETKAEAWEWGRQMHEIAIINR